MNNNIRHRRTKNRRALSFSIFKANKGFSLGLLILYLAGSILIMMTNLVPNSVEKMLLNFMDDYGLAEGSIVAQPSPTNFDDIKNISGIDKHESKFVLDSIIKFDEDILKQMRIFSFEDYDGIERLCFFEEQDCDNLQDYVWISKYLADGADIHAGEDIEIKTISGFKTFKVGAVISSTEAMSVRYDDSFWNEDLDFGCMYMPREVLDNNFGTYNLANYHVFSFKDGISVEDKRNALNEAKNIIGENNIKTCEIYEDSKAKSTFDANMDSLASACSVFPVATYIIMLICSCLFLFQIINNQRKKIGLLRALGYTPRSITNHFLRFVTVLTLASLILGSACGVYLSTYIVETYRAMYNVPDVAYVLSPVCIVLLLILLLTAIISCIIAARGVTKVDPGEACEGSYVTSSPYKFKLPIFNKINVFSKITFAKMLKNKRRFLLTSISIAACIVLCFSSISAYSSKAEALRFTFENRYDYDLLAFMNEDSNFYDKVSEIDGVSKVVPIIKFSDDFNHGKESYDIQINYVPENNELIKIFDKNMNEVYPADGVVVDEYTVDVLSKNVGDSFTILEKDLNIDNVFRLYNNPIQYINLQTAKSLGYDKYNACAIKLNSGVDTNEFFLKIHDLDGFEYLKFLDHQRIVKISNQRPLDLVFDSLIVLSILIGMIIVLNMVVIIVNERKFEYSTLLALGVEKSRFLKLTIFEYTAQYITAAIIAVLPAYFLSDIVLESMSEHLQDFPFVNLPFSYFGAYCLCLIFIVAGIVYTMIKIKKINPALELNLRG